MIITHRISVVLSSPLGEKEFRFYEIPFALQDPVSQTDIILNRQLWHQLEKEVLRLVRRDGLEWEPTILSIIPIREDI